VHARIQLSGYFNDDPNRPWITALAKAGGGALANGGSHWVDLARYLLGDVVEVSAQVSSSASGFEVEDTAALVMRTTADALVSYSSTWQSHIAVNDIDLAGVEGRIVASPFSEGRLLLQRYGREPEWMDCTRSGPAHSELIAALVPRLLAGEPSPVPGEEGMAVWRIMDAAYRSHREGRTIRIL
jgi:glucose-fructose oxidoreductase